MKRLGGWHRAFIAMTVGWLLFVGIYLLSSWPTRAHLWSISKRVAPPTFEALRNEFADDTIQIVLPNNDLVYFDAAAARGRVPELTADYWSAYQSQLGYDRLTLMFVGAVFVVVPVSLLYAIGWSVGWIYRGFRPEAVVLLLGAVSLASCGGSSPTSPSPTPTPSTVTIAGTITTTLTGEPVAGATVTIAGQAVATDANGRWSLSGQARDATLSVEVSAAGYLTRQTSLSTRQGRTDITIDLIRDGGAFSLSFFRQLARNGLEAPDGLQATRRWTQHPNFYIHAVNPKTGAALEASEVALVEAAIRAAVPQLSGGLLQAGAIEAGMVERPAVTGTIALSFVYDTTANFCGQALVGANPGRITINYDRCASACGSLKVTPETITHEVGHAMGFWHAGGSGIMDATRTRHCSNTSFSAAEQYHARVMYARQPGNMDIDRDASGATLLQGAGGGAPAVRCYR